MSHLYKKVSNQKDKYSSSWSFKEKIFLKLWQIVWCILFYITPKKFNKWRILLLKLFGANICWDAFIFPTAKIYAPWLLIMKRKACLGPNSNVYNLGPVTIKEDVTVSQYAFICNGTHDLTVRNMPLLIGHLIIENNVFIGANAFILPGLTIGEYAVVGACSVVTKNIKAFDIVGGNPAKFIKKRELKDD